VVGALQQILKAFLVSNIGYQTDRNYPKFYRNFLKNSDNGRFSLEVTNTFSLKTTSIKLKNNGDDIRLYLGLLVEF
jgi:hypothetical protein